MTYTKKRDISIDILKAFGIIFMVFGHCGFPYTHFIYLFHMAIFFIASGYCYKGQNSNDYKSVIGFVKRKMAGLWLPYVIWTTIYSLLHNFFIKINVYTDNPLLLERVSGDYIGTKDYWSWIDMGKNIIKAFFLHGQTQLGGALWFLATLMEVSVSYCLVDFVLRKLFKNDLKKTYIIQWIVSGFFLLAGFACYKMSRTFVGVDKILSYYVLFHMGYTIKKYSWSERERTVLRHILLLLSTFSVLIICNNMGSIALSKNSYTNPIYFLIVSFVGWQFVYELAYFIGKGKYLKRFLVVLGQNTLAIVILHFLCFKIVSYLGVLINQDPLCLIAAFPVLYQDGTWWIWYSLVGLLVPFSMSLLWKRVKKYFDLFFENERNVPFALLCKRQ